MVAKRRLGRLAEGTRRAIVIAPAAAGSTGDAAMLNATREQLRSRGFTHVAVALPAGWSAIDGFDAYHDWDSWFFGEKRGTRIRAAGELDRFSHSFMIGADCIDGIYNVGSITRRMTILDDHARLGGTAKIMGSSFSTRPHPDSIARLRSLDPRLVICARDPVSRERLIAVTGRAIEQTADLAFFTATDSTHPDARKALAFIDRQRREGRDVIGININYLIEHQHPGYAKAHGALIRCLLDAGSAVLLVPHDSRGDVNDAALLDRAVAAAGSALGDRIAMLDEAPPAATKAVLGALDMIVTGRMHAAILAMSAGTPAISFVYQGKFEGLYQLLDLADKGMMFDPADLVIDAEGVADRIVARLNDRENLSRNLAHRLVEVKALSNRNFE